MPLLTDRQEPDDPDRGQPSDDPNEYALRYLFQPNRPAVEYQRTGQTLFYAGVATNWLAFGLYLAWLDYELKSWPVGLAFLILGCSTLAAYCLFRRRRGLAFVVAVLTLGLALAVLVAGLLVGLPDEQAGYFFFFLPGSSATVAGGLLLRKKT